jgi:hypothetical protein
MTADPRVARLRTLDTEATPGPWQSQGVDLVSDQAGYDVAVTADGSVRKARADADLIAGQFRPWPKQPKLVTCRGCGRLAASEYRRTHWPDVYDGYPRLASADCCTKCWARDTAGAA